MKHDIYHRYDLPDYKDFNYEKQMCGRIAILILTGIAIIDLFCIVVVIAKMLATALVLVQ